MEYELFVTPGLGDNSWGGVPEWLARCYPQVAGRDVERS